MMIGGVANCTDCHNGQDRGRLLPGISEDNPFNLPLGIYDKVLHHQTMPPEEYHSTKDRLKMIEAIKNEYHNDLKKWFVKKSCSDNFKDKCAEYFNQTTNVLQEDEFAKLCGFDRKKINNSLKPKTIRHSYQQPKSSPAKLK